MASREQLAENTGMYVLPRPLYERVVTDDYTYVAGPNNAWVLDIREPNVEWARAESRRRGITLVEWWVGWSVRPSLADELLSAGLVPDDEPVLTGMTCATPPPEAPQSRCARSRRRRSTSRRSRSTGRSGRPRRTSARSAARSRSAASTRTTPRAWRITGRPTTTAGRWASARGIDMEDGVALMGGAVLPDARGRGVYRALVRARWDHAAARGTPLLVVQAGRMSAPVLDGLGFVRHGEIRLFADRL